MSNEIAKKTVLELDSISDYDDTVVGDNKTLRGSGGGGFLPEGTQIVFNFKRAYWQVKNGGDIITGKTVLLLDIIRTQIQWGPDGMPVAPPKILGPGEQFVDTDALNEAIDRSQWITDFNGNPKGPNRKSKRRSARRSAGHDSLRLAFATRDGEFGFLREQRLAGKSRACGNCGDRWSAPRSSWRQRHSPPVTTASKKGRACKSSVGSRLRATAWSKSTRMRCRSNTRYHKRTNFHG